MPQMLLPHEAMAAAAHPTFYLHLCALPPIGTHNTLQNLNLLTLPAIVDVEAVAALPLLLGTITVGRQARRQDVQGA